MQSAVAYQRAGQIFVASRSQTTAGVWIDVPPILVLSAPAAHFAIGLALQQSLEVSTQGVVHPADWKAISRPLLRAAGVAAYATFHKGTKCVEVESTSNGVLLVPTRNGGTGHDRGFHPNMPAAIPLPPNAPVEALGDAALRAFASCA